MHKQTTRPRLLPNRLTRLRPGALQPAGDMRALLLTLSDRLEAQPGIAASPMSGLDWERALIALDARVTLSWALGDKAAAKKARADVAAILAGIGEDGALAALSPWNPGMLLSRALRQAYLAMGDADILRAMLKLAHHQAVSLAQCPPSDMEAARLSQAVDDALWLYSVTGKPFLIKLAQGLRAASPDWSAVFHTFPDALAFERRIERADVEAAFGDSRMDPERRDWVRRQALQANGLNIAMGLKMPMLAHRMDGGLKDRQAPAMALERLMKAHGVACGMWTCDPYLAGDDPVKAVDVRAAAEALDSLMALLQFAGEAQFIESTERIGLNLLSAAVRENEGRGAHLVDGIAGEEDAAAWKAHGLSANADVAAVAAYARYASNLWMGHGAGIAALSYSPCALQATVNDRDVSVRVEGDYPHDGRVRMIVDPAAPMDFELWLYIPGWAEAATLRVGDAEPVCVERGAFHRIARRWEPGTRIALELPMRPFTSRWFHQTLAVERGPLVFALPTPEGASWKYALLDSGIGRAEADGEGDMGREAEGGMDGAAVPGAGMEKGSCPSVRLRVTAAPCEWKMSAGRLASPPVRPIVDAGAAAEIELLPYGDTDTRIAQFPAARVL